MISLQCLYYQTIIAMMEVAIFAQGRQETLLQRTNLENYLIEVVTTMNSVHRAWSFFPETSARFNQRLLELSQHLPIQMRREFTDAQIRQFNSHHTQ